MDEKNLLQRMEVHHGAQNLKRLFVNFLYLIIYNLVHRADVEHGENSYPSRVGSTVWCSIHHGALYKGESMNDEKEYYTVYEMAGRINRTAKTIYNWIEAGNIPSYTRTEGNRDCTLVCQEDVDDFLRPIITKTASKMETVDQ